MAVSGIVAVNQWKTGQDHPADDIIAGETPVALTYNKRSHVVMMATPADLEDFGLGFSLTEGIIQAPEELYAVSVIPRADGVEVAMTVSAECYAGLEKQRRNLTGRTGCGLCGAETLDQAVRYPQAVGAALEVNHTALEAAVEGLAAHQPLQAATGAVHCAAWCDREGNIALAREDVGRHNALDKLIGALIHSDLDPASGFVLVSSRASYEMVYKTAAVGVELMMAVSAPTTLAVEYARHAEMTLIGFARPGRHNIYTGPERVVEFKE